MNIQKGSAEPIYDWLPVDNQFDVTFWPRLFHHNYTCL